MHRLLGRGDLSRDEWQAAMDRYGVDSALLAYAGINRRVAWWDPARWALVFRGGDARVFVRRLPRFASLIAAHEIPATFAFSVEEGADDAAARAAPGGVSPVADCEWSRRLGDLLFELDGALSERARAAYERALAAPAACLAPRRRGAARRLAGRGRSRGGPAGATRSPCSSARSAPGIESSRPSPIARPRSRRSAARADAAAAWTDVAARAGDSPLAVRARARAARLRN